jgi:glycosyltransferase involved in cell wall biosynthesis
VTVSAILPALDEAAAIATVVQGLLGLVDEVVVADNGSTDGTGELALAAGARVVREPRRGFGAACFAGAAAATGDVLVFLDADGSFAPHDVTRIAAPVLDGRLDLSLGSRMHDGNAIAPWLRLANGTLGACVRLAGGPFLRDIGPLRAIRRETLLALDVRDRASAWPLEMVIRAARADLRIGELPVDYLPRLGGQSKVTGTVGGSLRAARQMSRLLVAEAFR